MSNITNYSNNINVLYPIAGQDNDSQGFRDNFSNIKLALTTASNEIDTLALELNPRVERTVILQNATGTISGSSLSLGGATISLSSSTNKNGKPILNIGGASGVSLTDGTTVQVTITNPHAGSTWPYTNSFSVDQPQLVKLGSTFKFYDAETDMYTVIGVNSTTVTTNIEFDPVLLSSHGITSGTTITLNNGKLLGSPSLLTSPPNPPLGGPGDKPGDMYITTGSVEICTGTPNGTDPVWVKLNTNIETNTLVKVFPSTVINDSTPNLVCDLSAGTRFFVDDPGTDLYVKFINLPPRPCQVEAFVTVRFNGTTSSIRQIAVDPDTAGRTVNYLVSNTLTDTTHNVELTPVYTPRYGMKNWITLMATTTTNVDVFNIELPF